VFGSALSQPGFISVGPIGDSVSGDRVEEGLVDELAEGRVVLTLDRDHGLKGFERLERSLETDGARFDAMFEGGLCRDRTDKVVGQNVRPKLFRTSSSVLQRKTSICRVRFNDRRSSSAFQRAR
jgi:hypothetical protein